MLDISSSLTHTHTYIHKYIVHTVFQGTEILFEWQNGGKLVTKVDGQVCMPVCIHMYMFYTHIVRMHIYTDTCVCMYLHVYVIHLCRFMFIM
jgi:hypothetical protein